MVLADIACRKRINFSGKGILGEVRLHFLAVKTYIDLQVFYNASWGFINNTS